MVVDDHYRKTFCFGLVDSIDLCYAVVACEYESFLYLIDDLGVDAKTLGKAKRYPLSYVREPCRLKSEIEDSSARYSVGIVVTDNSYRLILEAKYDVNSLYDIVESPLVSVEALKPPIYFIRGRTYVTLKNLFYLIAEAFSLNFLLFPHIHFPPFL